LRPLEESASEGSESPEPVDENDEDEEDGVVGDDDEEEEEEEEEEEGAETHQGSHTFEETMLAEIDLIESFAKGLRHQVQFRDQRMLNTLQREGASFLRLAKACMDKERRMNSTRSPTVSTWEKSTSSAMFYRTRPTCTPQPDP
jgi:cobalamin biosynthesis protein CobT